MFRHNTRLHLLSKMQDLQREKDQQNYETVEKIKKLLAETIEFSQKTAMASKRAGGSIDDNASARGSSTGRGDGVIRNLIGSPDDKDSRLGGCGSKTTGGGGPQFLNVVEQQEEEVESSTGEVDINIQSAEA